MEFHYGARGYTSSEFRPLVLLQRCCSHTFKVALFGKRTNTDFDLAGHMAVTNHLRQG